MWCKNTPVVGAVLTTIICYGEHRGHGATEVVGVEGHGYVNGGGGRGVAVFAVAEDRGLRRRTTGNNNLTVLNNFNGKDLLEIKR